MFILWFLAWSPPSTHTTLVLLDISCRNPDKTRLPNLYLPPSLNSSVSFIKFSFLTMRKMENFKAPCEIGNGVTSHFVIPDALCNNSLPHFVIKLLSPTLQYEICQKSLRNCIVTLSNRIIIRILLLTLKMKIYHISTSTRLMATTLGRLVS